MSTRRNKLADVKYEHSTNVGLWLDKYIQDATSKEQDKNRLVEEVASIRGPMRAHNAQQDEVYDLAFNRWEKLMKDEEAAGRAIIGYGSVIGRLAIGRGESVLETSVRLHHTYGVPYIPGSALKGTAASFARNYLDENDWGKGKGGAYEVIFGKQEDAGYVTFHDALLKPRTGRGSQKEALHQDVLTPHHPDYYQGKDVPPADWDSPDIIPFLSATGTYLIALTAPDGCQDWLSKALAILKLALSEEGIGIGAKTSSGYGRMKLEANR